ncbi:SPOR domain-containing protein [Oerskovia turbata]
MTNRPEDDDQPAEDQYYFDTRTGEVSKGPQKAWTSRMGPYPTREAAAQALERGRAHTEAWDEEDREREQDR